MKRTTSQTSSIMIPKKGKINMTKTSVTNKGLGWQKNKRHTNKRQKTHKQKEKRSKTKKKGGEKRRERTKKKKKTLRGNKEEKPDHIGEG